MAVMAGSCETEVAPTLKKWADRRLTPGSCDSCLLSRAHSCLATLVLQIELHGGVSSAR